MTTVPVHSPLMPSVTSPSYQHNHHHHHSSDASRPSLGFPLGTALLLVIIFSLSGVFSCCYHWDKFRSLRRSYAAAAAAAASVDLESGGDGDKVKTSLMVTNEGGVQSVPVLMPGEQMPRFIALPSPCAPLRPENPPPPSLVEEDKTANHTSPKPTSSTSSLSPISLPE